MEGGWMGYVWFEERMFSQPAVQQQLLVTCSLTRAIYLVRKQKRIS